MTTMPQHRADLIAALAHDAAKDATHAENRINDLQEARIRLNGIIRRHHAYTSDLVAVFNTFGYAKIDVNRLFDDEEGDYLTNACGYTCITDLPANMNDKVRIACLRLWLLASYKRGIQSDTHHYEREQDGADSRLALFREWEEGRR